MDAAAKTVESLSQQILPGNPHHLSYDVHWRYRPPPNDASRPGTRFEEWHHPRLQYMTLISQADRGTLFTRSYYDMREEPPKPVPREVSALAKSGPDKKKKLSLSDYKSKKTGAPVSASPPEPAIAKRKQGDGLLHGSQAPVTNAAAAPKPINPETKPLLDSHKPPSNWRKPDAARHPDPQHLTSDTKQRTPRESTIDMRLPPKPPSLPPKPTSPPMTKKRVADVEDEFRPQKRPRPDERKADEKRPADRPPPSRDDGLRRKERPLPSVRDAPPHKEDRPTSSSSLPNGRPIFKGALASTRTSSPGARPRADAVNGVRPHSGGSNSGATTKPDSKSYVPPLLSPLKLSFDGDSRPPATDDDSRAKKEKKRRDDSREMASTIKAAKKPEPLSGSKRSKLPLSIPPLLSPTLPPAVEAELRREKKGSPELADDLPKDAKDSRDTKDVRDSKDARDARDAKDAPGSKRRPASGGHEQKPNKLGHRRRLIVSLSIPRGLRQSVRKILAPLSDRTDANSRDRERGREHDRPRDRLGDETSQVAQARKRPAGSADTHAELTAMKRPRMSDMARVAAAPSTPSKRTTAMSRGSSNNSMAQTPGEAVNATPLAALPADRRLNGHDTYAPRPDRPEVKVLQNIECRLKDKAISLKHDADETMKTNRGELNAAAGKGNLDEKIKRMLALFVESILAFIMSFHAQNVWRGISNKKNDPQTWESILPLIEHINKELARNAVDRSKPLYALVLLLHAIVLDEVIKCYAHLEPLSSNFNVECLLKLERQRARLWPTIRGINAHLCSSGLRVEGTPWFSIDDVTGAGLRILRTWCSEEKVDWTPEAILRESWPIDSRRL